MQFGPFFGLGWPASSASAASSAVSNLNLSRRWSAFLVEEMECRQADVGHLLLTERDFLWGRDPSQGSFHPWPAGYGGGGAARQ